MKAPFNKALFMVPTLNGLVNQLIQHLVTLLQFSIALLDELVGDDHQIANVVHLTLDLAHIPIVLILLLVHPVSGQ